MRSSLILISIIVISTCLAEARPLPAGSHVSLSLSFITEINPITQWFSPDDHHYERPSPSPPPSPKPASPIIHEVRSPYLPIYAQNSPPSPYTAEA